MARPIAVGLKYFPFDVDLLDDEALDFLRDKYGMIVNEVYIGLLCLLYKKYGYYIPYETEKEKEDCVWYIYKHIRGGKYPPDIKTIATVIDACVARELFSRELYPKIITSKRAQSTFYSCTVERKSVPICPDVWLLDVNDMGKLSKKHPYYLSLCLQDKSNEKPNYSDDKQNKSDEKPLNKINLNNTSNEVFKESKKVSREEGRNKQKRDSYEEILSRYNVGSNERKIIFEFVRHCQLNGHTLTNDALTRALEALITYPEERRCEVVRDAIDRNQYAIKPLTEKHYDIFGIGNQKRSDYQSVMERNLKGYLDDDDAESVISRLWGFIQHCAANGQKMTNDRLRYLCNKLKKLYRPSDASGMIYAIDKAIGGGYYDIKDGEGWIAQSVAQAKSLGIPLPGDDISESDDGE